MRINLIKTLFILLLFGILLIEGSNALLEIKLEESIKKKYPDSGEIKVNTSILCKNIGNIAKLHINLVNWQMENYEIERFEMCLQNVKINWQELFNNNVTVLEYIGTGWMRMTIDEKAVSYFFSSKTKGFKTKIMDDKLLINYQLNILGGKIDAFVWGVLKPYQKSTIIFEPQKIIINDYVLSGELKDKIMKKLKIKVQMENIPFDFNLTTVKIMQDKVFLEGIV